MMTLRRWERGFSVAPADQLDMVVYFWFYEWNMFEAVHEGQHTRGRFDFEWNVESENATLDCKLFRVSATAVEDGATLNLSVTNNSGRDWPEEAAIIPCFNPGHKNSVGQNLKLVDDSHSRTYFVGGRGPALLQQREIHFNERLKTRVDAQANDGEFVFSDKWPNMEENSTTGLIIREATDGKWVAAIGWEDFLSAQGHNPWGCMHLSVCVGPLSDGETKDIRGRIYLFEGTKEDCLEKYRRDLL